MKRLRTLLIAAVCALALTAAAGASVASASGILFEKYPTTVTGTETGSAHVFSLEGKSYICSMPALSAVAGGPTETLVSPASGTTCSNTFEGPVTLKANGCNWIYHPALSGGSFEIGPSGCGPITMEGTYCTRSFGAQSGLAATFSNQGSGSSASVKVEDNALIAYTVTKGSVVMCGKSGNASYVGTWSFTGKTNGGEPNGAHLAAPAALYLSGKASEEPANQPKFNAEAYPQAILGPQSASDKYLLSFGPRKFECAEVATVSSLAAAGASLGLDVTYRDCKGYILGTWLPAVVTTNSCDYTLNASNVGPPYAGTLGVSCAGEGEGIEATAYSEDKSKVMCTFKVGTQAGHSGVALDNFGVFGSPERGVEAEFDVEGVEYTKTSGTLANCGKASGTATYTGTTRLNGAK
ncbi:MAG TPA: hypothetical protein VFY48_03850 [Solirubrobacterales bacterium]|nr:hypothetical protein [Solirubrobacterales bacterium]